MESPRIIIFFVCIVSTVHAHSNDPWIEKIYTNINPRSHNNLQKAFKNQAILQGEAKKEQQMFDTMKEELKLARSKNFEKQMRKGNIFKRNIPSVTPYTTPSTTIDLDSFKKEQEEFIDELPKAHRWGAERILRKYHDVAVQLNNNLIQVQFKCRLYELLLGVRRELEETEDEFWEQLNFPSSEDRTWKWIASLLLLNTPEAAMWRELLKKNNMSIEQFARYVASLYDSLSKRDHRNVLIPRECVSIDVLNELLKAGDLDCLTVEQRIVITMAVEMRRKREDRSNWKIDENTTATNKIAGSDNFRCVLLEPVEMGDPKGLTLPPTKSPTDEQGTTLATQRKSVTSFPRNLPYQTIRNVFFPWKLAQKSTEFMCELEDSYNAKKTTGTILVRFSTVEIAAQAILARQTPKTVKLKMVKCDEYQAKCSHNQVYIAESINVQPTTRTPPVSNAKNDHASTKL